MRRSEKNWMEYDELTKPFLSPDSDESVTSVAIELRDRMVKVEQQVLAQYTATAAYATLGQQSVEQARAEARSDLDRAQSTAIGLIDKLRREVIDRLDGLDARHAPIGGSLSHDADSRLSELEHRLDSVLVAFEHVSRENAVLRQQVDELLQRQMQSEGWLVSNGSSSDLSLL
jgi:hypothetical protein